MKKIIPFIIKYKKRFIVVVILLIGYAFFGPKKSTVAVPTLRDTVAVELGSIQSTLQVLGSTNLVTSQSLTFGAAGRVKKINVKQGDTVKKGAVLAEIDRRDADNDIRGQELAIQSAQITFDKLFSNIKPYQITQAQVNAVNASGNIVTSKLQVENLKVEKEIKIQEQEELIAEKEKSLSIINAQGSNSTIQDYSAQSVTAQNDGLDSIQQGRDAVRTLDDMFHTTEPFNQSLFYIGARKDGLLGDAQRSITALKGALDTFQPIYNTYSLANPKTLDIVLKFQNDNKTFLNQFAKTAQATSEAIVNSLVDSRYYTDTQITSDRSKLTSMNSKVISLLNSINSNIKQSQSNDTDRLVLQNDIDAAKRNIDKLKLDYDLQIAKAQNDILNSIGSAQVNSENAESLISGPTDDEKAAIANQIAQAQLGLTKSKKKLEDYQIIAQFDGDVSAIDFKVGDQVTAQSGAITVEVPGIYEVNVLLDQLDIVKVNIGQQATIAFDSFPNETFTGEIGKIDPTPQVSQGVVSYTATIYLQKGGKNIYNQMSATVNIILEQKNDILLISSLGITTSGNTKTVQVWKDGALSTRDVTIGINNGQQAEVISGLKEGERITTKLFKIVNKVQGFSFGPPRNANSSSSPTNQTRQIQNGGNR